MAGRGVDLNRNWSVDWGKKEKVGIYLLSSTMKNVQEEESVGEGNKTFFIRM